MAASSFRYAWLPAIAIISQAVRCSVASSRCLASINSRTSVSSTFPLIAAMTDFQCPLPPQRGLAILCVRRLRKLFGAQSRERQNRKVVAARDVVLRVPGEPLEPEGDGRVELFVMAERSAP